MSDTNNFSEELDPKIKDAVERGQGDVIVAALNTNNYTEDCKSIFARILIGSNNITLLNFVIKNSPVFADYVKRNTFIITTSAVAASVEMTKYIIEYYTSIGIDITNSEELYNSAALWRPDVFTYLAKTGYNIHIGDDSSLRDAVKAGFIETVVTIVEDKAPCEAVFLQAFRTAFRYKRKYIAEYLIRKCPYTNNKEMNCLIEEITNPDFKNITPSYH